MRYLVYILLFTLTSIIKGQTFQKLSIKIGSSLSGQIKTPPIFADGGIKRGFSGTIEPTILSFGSKKKLDFNTDISFTQKGGYNYSPIVTNGSIGSESYPVIINYLSFSPTIKINFWKILFIKVGPRLDIFTSFLIKRQKVLVDKRTKKDFNPMTYGVTYGLGICVGKKKVKFLSEFIGQNDFSYSSYNAASGQRFKNFCYILNFGVAIELHKQDK